MNQCQKCSQTTIIPQFIIPLNSSILLQKSSTKTSKTKKICTLGPKTSTIQMILKLIDNGANVARLNFSHGTHEGHQKYINLVNQALKKRPYHHMSILLDTKGPQIRTGNNQNEKQINFQKGQLLQIVTDNSIFCTNNIISCSYKDLAKSVKIDSQILFADGKISSIVKKIDNQKNKVFVQILNNGSMGSKKNMCLPGCEITLPTINEYDENDIINFGVKHKVDFIAVSFSRFKKDIQYIRKIIAEKDRQYAQKVQIISKIQNTQALLNLDQIIQASNGIMIARGDLGMQTPLQKIILLQKIITTKCLNAGKYVIVATQMLQSMQTKPRPTRAQVSDITNTVLDLADSTMTSGQTANGQFPEQTVKYMKKISIQTQRTVNYKKVFQHRINSETLVNNQGQCYYLIKKSFDEQVDIIFVKTDNIQLINKISSLRPQAYVYVFSNLKQIQKYTALNFGVYCFNEEFFSKPKDFLLQIKSIFGVNNKLKILFSEWNNNKLNFNHKIVQIQLE